jgi:hypothetical protein
MTPIVMAGGLEATPQPAIECDLRCREGKPVPTPLSKCGAGFFRIMR